MIKWLICRVIGHKFIYKTNMEIIGDGDICRYDQVRADWCLRCGKDRPLK